MIAETLSEFQKYDRLNKIYLRDRLNKKYLTQTRVFYFIFMTIITLMIFAPNGFSVFLLKFALFYSVFVKYHLNKLNTMENVQSRSLIKDFTFTLIACLIFIIFLPSYSNLTILYYGLYPMAAIFIIFNIFSINKDLKKLTNKDYEKTKLLKLKELRKRIQEKLTTIEECEYHKAICIENKLPFSTAEINKRIKEELNLKGFNSIHDYKIKNHKTINASIEMETN